MREVLGDRWLLRLMAAGLLVRVALVLLLQDLIDLRGDERL